MLGPGDLIFHPRHGFGTISGMTRRDPLHPIQDGVSKGVSDQTQAYYDIQLMDGGTLLVPVGREARVGLRLLTNGVDAITLCLNSPAQSLPADSRKRAAELWAHGQIRKPTTLAASVRDMLAQSHGRVLTASERRGSTNPASASALKLHWSIVFPDEAHAAIWEAVNQLNAT